MSLFSEVLSVFYILSCAMWSRRIRLSLQGRHVLVPEAAAGGLVAGCFSAGTAQLGISASRTGTADSLEGTWRPELIFVLPARNSRCTSDGLPSATSSCKITWLVLLTRSRLQGSKTYLRKRKRSKTRINPLPSRQGSTAHHWSGSNTSTPSMCVAHSTCPGTSFIKT